MKQILILSFLCTINTNANTQWGKTGHRTIGEIASHHIHKKTKKRVNKLLNHASLAFASTYSDEIRSDRKYQQYGAWHYVNFEDGTKYGDKPISTKGDIVQAIKKCVYKIRDDKNSDDEKAFYLKMLIHFVGDLHMPLHTGHKEDKGGNDIDVKWFGATTNLHAVWDTKMIDHYKMSYTELANNTKHLNKYQVNDIEQGTLLDWVYESKALSGTIYDSAKQNDNLKYKYMYLYFPLVRKRLHKAGIRLAKVLNETFKKDSKWLDTFFEGVTS